MKSVTKNIKESLETDKNPYTISFIEKRSSRCPFVFILLQILEEGGLVVCLRGNLQEKKISFDADDSKVRLTSKSVSWEWNIHFVKVVVAIEWLQRLKVQQTETYANLVGTVKMSLSDIIWWDQIAFDENKLKNFCFPLKEWDSGQPIHSSFFSLLFDI